MNPRYRFVNGVLSVVNAREVICSRLFEERKRLGLTQVKAAQGVGVSREMWKRYEKATATPNADVLVKARIIGMDVAYILGGFRRINDSTISAPAAALVLNQPAPTSAPDPQAGLSAGAGWFTPINATKQAGKL